MNSECELCYDHYVVSSLCHMAVSEKERTSLILDFFHNREERYDLLCENTYRQAIGLAENQSLWLTPCGESYLAKTYRYSKDICLISADECIPLHNNLNDQLQQLCHAMETAAAKRNI